MLNFTLAKISTYTVFVFQNLQSIVIIITGSDKYKVYKAFSY